MSNNAKTSRRAFVLRGAGTLGAGAAMAATAGAAALSPDAPSAIERLAQQDDVEAIRRVHAQFVRGVEDASRAGARNTHRAYRANARQCEDTLQISPDRRHASARWHVDVQVVTPLEGDCTIAQMARLQGNSADTHWESGRLSTRYEKKLGTWHMTEMEYSRT